MMYSDTIISQTGTMLYNGKNCQEKNQGVLWEFVWVWGFFQWSSFSKSSLKLSAMPARAVALMFKQHLNCVDNQQSFKIYKREPFYIQTLQQFQALPIYSIYSIENA